eukprot:gb/GEZN01003924.1/.p1 GENE.gb/GEZN01003924.1/~~gb/GEZN01003924.1/.p1  ORF type:complete len:595 (-),score=39.64 gb/GEZN01003924.1/:222-2006(-)
MLTLFILPLTRASVLNFSFQHKSLPAPAGYLIDNGEVYGNHSGTDLRYGWDGCDLSEGDNLRNRNISGNVLMDNFILSDRDHKCGDQFHWKLKVANARYRIEISYCDPLLPSLSKGCLLNGIPAAATDVSTKCVDYASPSHRWKGEITVTDNFVRWSGKWSRQVATACQMISSISVELIEGTIITTPTPGPLPAVHYTQRCMFGDPSVDISRCSPSSKFTYKYDDCPVPEDLPRHCLLSKIPLNTTYRRLACCFKCCVKLWSNWMGLRFREQDSDLFLLRFWPERACHRSDVGGICRYGEIRGAFCNSHNSKGCGAALFSEKFNQTAFIKQLDQVKEPYVMILYHDHDIPGTSTYPAGDRRNSSWLLDHPSVEHVFAQNIEPGFSHPKLSVRPRTLYEQHPPVRILIRQFLLAKENEPMWKPPTELKFICDAFNPKIGPRFVVMKKFPKDIMDKYKCKPEIANHSKYYNWTHYADRVANSTLFMSPRGWGHETPKPLETSYLGCASVIAYTPKEFRAAHMPLWTDAPVLILKDGWETLTEKVMHDFLAHLRENFTKFDMSRLMQPYWLYQYSQFYHRDVQIVDSSKANKIFGVR